MQNLLMKTNDIEQKRKKTGAIAGTTHMTAMRPKINAIVSHYRLRLRLLSNFNILYNYYVLQACRGNKHELEMHITSPKEQKMEMQQSKNNWNDSEVYEEVGSPQTTPPSADFLVCYATALG